MSSNVVFEIPKDSRTKEAPPPTYEESVNGLESGNGLGQGGRNSPFEEKPLDSCTYQVNIEGEANMEIVTEIDYKTGKPKMSYVVKRKCSHCGSKIKPKVQGKFYPRMEKFVSFVVCFAGIMALVYFFIDLWL